MSSGSVKKRNRDAVRRRKKNKRKYLLYYILFFIILAAAACILSLTVFFKIEAITLTGDVPYSESEILEAVGVKKGDNLIRVSEDKAVLNLGKKFPYIASIRFKRIFPSELLITAEKEIPAIACETENRTAILSKNGKVLEIMNCENNKGLSRVNGIDTENLLPGDSVKDSEKERLSILNSLQTCLMDANINADIIDISDLSAIRFLYDGRVDVFMGGTFEHDYKINFAKMAIEKSVDKNFVGVLDVSKRPTARLRPTNIYDKANWQYPDYMLSDYEKVLLIKPNVINPVESEKEISFE